MSHDEDKKFTHNQRPPGNAPPDRTPIGDNFMQKNDSNLDRKIHEEVAKFGRQGSAGNTGGIAQAREHNPRRIAQEQQVGNSIIRDHGPCAASSSFQAQENQKGGRNEEASAIHERPNPLQSSDTTHSTAMTNNQMHAREHGLPPKPAQLVSKLQNLNIQPVHSLPPKPLPSSTSSQSHSRTQARGEDHSAESRARNDSQRSSRDQEKQEKQEQINRVIQCPTLPHDVEAQYHHEDPNFVDNNLLRRRDSVQPPTFRRDILSAQFRADDNLRGRNYVDDRLAGRRAQRGPQSSPSQAPTSQDQDHQERQRNPQSQTIASPLSLHSASVQSNTSDSGRDSGELTASEKNFLDQLKTHGKIVYDSQDKSTIVSIGEKHRFHNTMTEKQIAQYLMNKRSVNPHLREGEGLIKLYELGVEEFEAEKDEQRGQRRDGGDGGFELRGEQPGQEEGGVGSEVKLERTQPVQHDAVKNGEVGSRGKQQPGQADLVIRGKATLEKQQQPSQNGASKREEANPKREPLPSQEEAFRNRQRRPGDSDIPRRANERRSHGGGTDVKSINNRGNQRDQRGGTDQGEGEAKSRNYH